MCKPCFFNLLMDTLVASDFSAVVNSAAVNTGVQISLEILLFFGPLTVYLLYAIHTRCKNE